MALPLIAELWVANRLWEREGRVYSHGPSGDPTYSSDAVWIVPNSWLHTWPFKLCNNSNYWKELIKAEGVGRFGKE